MPIKNSWPQPSQRCHRSRCLRLPVLKSGHKRHKVHKKRIFPNQLQAPHAFKLVIDRDFVAADPFTRHQPTLVPARTLLSQLL